MEKELETVETVKEVTTPEGETKEVTVVEKQEPKVEMTEEEAYILTYTMAQGHWGRKPLNSAAIDYYDYMLRHTGYFAICGAKGCIRACMDMLEKAGRTENVFHNAFYRKPEWTLPVGPVSVSEGVNPFREAYLDERYPGIRKNEYKKTED